MRWPRIACVGVVWLILAAPGRVAAGPPPVELVDDYQSGLDLSQFWLSEKYDGVRGYWTGDKLLTRGGNEIHAPAWFTAGWPATPMDGELWAGYGSFAQASATVRAADAGGAEWRQMSYRVFDLPRHGGPFGARVPAIRETVAAIDRPWVVAVRQFQVADEKALRAAFERVRKKGGEGLVLHRASARYAPGRHGGLYKLKPYRDAEARVVGINPGQGRLADRMGSLEVRTPAGRRFAIGTGFTDAQRADPPPVGSWITYRYNGRTATGLPRFARFLHRRPGGPPPEAVSTP